MKEIAGTPAHPLSFACDIEKDGIYVKTLATEYLNISVTINENALKVIRFEPIILKSDWFAEFCIF